MWTRTTWNLITTCLKKFFPNSKISVFLLWKNFKSKVQQQPKKKSFVLITQGRIFLPFYVSFQPLFVHCKQYTSKLQNSTEDNIIKYYAMPPKAVVNILVLWIKQIFNHYINDEISNILSLILFPILHLYPWPWSSLPPDKRQPLYQICCVSSLCFSSFTMYWYFQKQHEHCFTCV